ncbi:MAG: alcohol dehydrogenase [Acidiferrobacteraceae bacterium]|jgi:NADP-dependent 3-hydroxy acid dehydrogenase YdfG|nr:alcohol dehydrogenase [Acidiferrobacteraceae bacterium]MCP4841559.1 SDR family oxidoreductase [Halieaceae bacterium]MDP6951115.1 SDR family oxidoreductase [Arenicellales bacterium]HJP07222.1 SDR family oxidoreductase [Arenicellales bacterium]|tara:strand:- start:1464 stop:2201 length:738 start_codon:yes stop_codon:yes gene_type:complete
MTGLKEKTALVTGASSGIGLATAQMLSTAGVRVIGCARRLDRLQAKMDALPGPALAMELDVADATAVAGLPGRLPQDWQAVDILVNNAGSDVGGRQPFHQGDINQWAGTIQTNVTGLMRVTAALLPGMLERRQGHIVNLGSTQGLVPMAGCGAYAASKFAVHGFTETLRQEYAGTGIRVSEVLPGMVKTDFAQTRFSSVRRGEAFYQNYGQCLEAEDIARSVLFVLEQPPHTVIAQIVIAPDNAG